MLKIFLVEDEVIVREGMKKNIDWLSHGYEFCGEASDGEQAYPMIQALKPDIVITDIKMPFMDGLSLSRLVRKNFPDTEIIILSGYSEFEYAKEAIKIGVAQYVSKPISAEELLTVIETVSVRIQKQREEKEILEKYEKETEENLLAEKRVLFQYLVTGEKTVPEIIELGERINISLTSMWYNVVLLKIQTKKVYENEIGTILTAIKESSSLADTGAVLLFDRTPEGSALLFQADTRDRLLMTQKLYLQAIRNKLDTITEIRYFAGIGIPVDRLSSLPESFEKASHAFAHRYLINGNQIMDYINPETEKSDLELLNTSQIDTKQLDRTRIREFLKFGTKREVGYFVDEFLKGLGSTAMDSSIFRQYIVMDTFFSITEFLDETNLPKTEIIPPEAVLQTLKSKNVVHQYLVQIIDTVLDLRDRAVCNRYAKVVHEVKSYIEKHYSDDDLSLNLLAAQVNFSPNHLSMIFSQETGQTLIKYVTDYRMNRAKEMLRCTGKRANVIGLEVGYKDPHYFSFLFKKTQGITPTQYREKEQ